MSETAADADGPAEAKRARVGPSPRSMLEADSKLSPLDPPSDTWANHVMPFLPYIDIINCTAINHAFLRDVAALVRDVYISSAAEMKVAPARRFCGVESIRIGCIYKHSGELEYEDDEDSDLVVEHSVVGLITPFLQLFPALKMAEIGLFDPAFRDYGALESAHRRTPEGDRLMQTLQTSICGAYRLGSISPYVEIIGADAPCPNYGVDDTNDDDEDEPPCALCMDYCRSYPLKIVADTSHSKSFPVCLPISDVVDIVLKRPGGREYLTTTEYFIRKHIDLAVRDSALVEVLREMDLVPENITRQDVDDILTNKKGYSIAHTCNEQELEFFHESGITCLTRSDFRSVRPVAPSDTRGIWW
mmetsp:Transcript_37704/g.82781  ORF Transcript_37704/g.82781 Transcript_37704/m.82781 type:complete len:360 (+) Transcript_37704:242-1321(+)